MSNFDQRNQQVGTQINAESVTFNIALSTPAPRTDLLWFVPYSRNPSFTGREDVLQHLHTALISSKNAALTQAISGLGGIGKTQVALEYLYRYHQEYRAIFWVRAGSREELLNHYTQLARVIGLPEQNQQQIVEAVMRWLQSNTSWLLIVDNADDLAMIKTYLPTHVNGHILLTTRAQATSSLAKKFELSTFSLHESIMFLFQRIGVVRQDETLFDSIDEKTRSSAQAIAQELGFLPLALDQAGAYIEENSISLSEYLTLFQGERKELLAIRGGIQEDHVPVATTWSLAFKQLEVQNSASLELIRICAFLASDAIAEEMFLQASPSLSSTLQEAVGKPLLWNRIIADVGKYSLLRRQPETRTISVHRLVQAVIYDEMDDATRHQWAETAVHIVSRVFPFDEVTPWIQSQRYVTDALTSLEHVDQLKIENEDINSLRNDVASYFSNRGQYFSAQALYEQVLINREKILGLEHPNTSGTRQNLANLYYKLGKIEQAQTLYEQCLTSLEKLLGPEHPNTLTTRQNLASIYTHQGKYEQAQALYEQVLISREKILGLEHPDTLSIRHNIAAFYHQIGKIEQAQTLYEQVLANSEKLLGPEHPHTLTTRQNLASLYKNQGKFKQAQDLYEQVLISREKILGLEHPDTLDTYEVLANLYYPLGKIEQALLLYEQVLTSREKLLGPEHPDTLKTRQNLAILYSLEGKIEQGLNLYEQVLTSREKLLGPEHPDTLKTRQNLAALHHQLSKDKQARS